MERWKDIPGYKGRYQASTAGRVRSLDREVFVDERKSKRGNFIRKCKGRILKPGPHPSGHLSIALGANNSQLVHQLVLLTFVGPMPDGHETLHKNHKPADNRLTNLKYGTRSENLKADYENGSRRGLTRAVCGESIKGGTQVKFPSMRAAAASLHLQNPRAESHISDCCSGRIKTAYGYMWRYV